MKTDLGHEDVPRINLASPWEVACILSVPGKEIAAKLPTIHWWSSPARGKHQCQVQWGSNRMGEQWRDGVTDLAIPKAWLTRKAEPVGECLDARSLADREGPILIGMDIPVPIFGDMRSDGPAEAPPFEPLVLVRKDVGAIALKPRGKLLVGVTFLEQSECLSVIGPDIASYVVVHEAAVLMYNSRAKMPLEFCPRPRVWDALLALCGGHDRKITNCLAHRGRLRIWLRPLELLCAWFQSNNEQSASVLRYAVLIGMEDLCPGSVAQLTQRLAKAD